MRASEGLKGARAKAPGRIKPCEAWRQRMILGEGHAASRQCGDGLGGERRRGQEDWAGPEGLSGPKGEIDPEREEEMAAVLSELMPQLPAGVRLMAEALGDPRLVARVLSLYGGRTLRVPSAMPGPGHALRARLGEEALRGLVAHLGGTDVYVPACRGILNRLRQSDIIRAFSRAIRGGMGSVRAVAHLAERYSLSDRRIWQILKTSPNVSERARLLRGPGAPKLPGAPSPPGADDAP